MLLKSAYNFYLPLSKTPWKIRICFSPFPFILLVEFAALSVSIDGGVTGRRPVSHMLYSKRLGAAKLRGKFEERKQMLEECG
jgi:hypothetical protein